MSSAGRRGAKDSTRAVLPRDRHSRSRRRRVVAAPGMPCIALGPLESAPGNSSGARLHFRRSLQADGPDDSIRVLRHHPCTRPPQIFVLCFTAVHRTTPVHRQPRREGESASMDHRAGAVHQTVRTSRPPRRSSCRLRGRHRRLPLPPPTPVRLPQAARERQVGMATMRPPDGRNVWKTRNVRGGEKSMRVTAHAPEAARTPARRSSRSSRRTAPPVPRHARRSIAPPHPA